MQDVAQTERRAWLKLPSQRKPMAAWATDVHAGPCPDSLQPQITHIRRIDGLPCIHVFADEPHPVKRR